MAWFLRVFKVKNLSIVMVCQHGNQKSSQLIVWRNLVIPSLFGLEVETSGFELVVGSFSPGKVLLHRFKLTTVLELVLSGDGRLFLPFPLFHIPLLRMELGTFGL